MTLSVDDKRAIYFLLRSMALADEMVSFEERMVLDTELSRMGFNQTAIDIFEEEIANSYMNSSCAFAQLSGMSDEKKKYVSAALTLMMNIDGMDEREEKLLKLACRLTGTPEMTVGESLAFLENVGTMYEWEDEHPEITKMILDSEEDS